MTSDKGREREAETKRRRLALALRENLKRRKAQQRGRQEAVAPNASPDVRPGDEQKI
ncbi:MAG TPA: hypothetical protein VKU03_13780 [Roseiarcus sp.]|nr:hypothetical protein [Roseiarcus sp.]